MSKYYNHSRVTIAVNDKSIKIPTPQQMQVNKVFLLPDFFQDGPENVVRYFADPISYKRGVGDYNFRTHGQGPYMGNSWIAGKGVVAAVKLCAPDASAAYLALNIRTKETTVPVYQMEADGVTQSTDVDGNPIEIGTRAGVIIIPRLEEVPTTAIADLVNRDHQSQMQETISNLKTIASADDFTNNYAAVFKIKGKGSYGNRFGLKIALNAKNEKLITDGRRYVLTIVEKDRSGFASAITEPVSFSLNYDARDISDTKSEFISEVLTSETFTNYFDQLLVEVDPDFHDTFAGFAQNTLGFSAADAENIDWIHGIDKTTKAGYNNILIPEEGEDGYDQVMDLSTNNFMTGGSDGALDPKGTHDVEGSQVPNTTASIAALKEQLLVDFYMGKSVKEIVHPYLHRISYVLDAAYPVMVKEAMMHYAVNLRGDVLYKLDTLFAPDPYAAAAFKDTINASAFSWHGELCYGYGIATDPDTGKEFKATWTLEAAYQLARIYNANNKTQRNYAGEKNGLVTTMTMVGDPLSDEEMDYLTDEGIGYFETVDNDTVAKMSTRTLYSVEGAQYSHLAEERNADTVGEMLYTGRRVLSSYRYDDSVSQAQNDINCKKETDKNFSKFAASSIIKNLSTEIYRTEDDVLNSEARCRVAIDFEGFDKTFHLSIEPYRE